MNKPVLPIADYPALHLAKRHGETGMARALARTLVTARECGAPDDTLKRLVLLLRAPDIALIDDVEAQGLIDRFGLSRG